LTESCQGRCWLKRSRARDSATKFRILRSIHPGLWAASIAASARSIDLGRSAARAGPLPSRSARVVRGSDFLFAHYRSIPLPFEFLRPRRVGPFRRDLIHANLLGRPVDTSSCVRRTTPGRPAWQVSNLRAEERSDSSGDETFFPGRVGLDELAQCRRLDRLTRSVTFFR
jgi:hypothetical protein